MKIIKNLYLDISLWKILDEQFRSMFNDEYLGVNKYKEIPTKMQFIIRAGLSITF